MSDSAPHPMASRHPNQTLLMSRPLQKFPRSLGQSLAWMHVAGAELLPFFTAAELRALEPLLGCHETLLDAPATQLGALRPGRPRLHLTACAPQDRRRILVSGQKCYLY